ncbi:hypothetical protein Brsp01_47490 [Brucella sp. NBRC 12950]|nr:hypothetical protein Brsp01_47490 [Brucella sp. NBRC 12950]
MAVCESDGHSNFGSDRAALVMKVTATDAVRSAVRIFLFISFSDKLDINGKILSTKDEINSI